MVQETELSLKPFNCILFSEVFPWNIFSKVGFGIASSFLSDSSWAFSVLSWRQTALQGAGPQAEWLSQELVCNHQNQHHLVLFSCQMTQWKLAIVFPHENYLFSLQSLLNFIVDTKEHGVKQLTFFFKLAKLTEGRWDGAD